MPALPPESTVHDLAPLTAAARAGHLGPDPASLPVSVGFLTQQGARHAHRGRGYRNHVLSLRVAEAVGSCAVEPGEVDDGVALDCVGRCVAELLEHPAAAVRVAVLDAYLMHARPHATAAEAVTIPAGTSLHKSLRRAELVVDLLPLPPGRTVLVVGVVNSLLHHLRERGLSYVACDYGGGFTEWGEPIVDDAMAAVEDCDAILASGMTVGNATFWPLLAHARRTGRPLVVFAQTGSAILPHLLDSGLTALSAEPYPFFWLDGGPTTIYRYRRPTPAPIPGAEARL
ncbi:Rossmann-like domain-containing protein [Salinactinospora qingdaonensis]|uniref:Putative heavy-metal chelation domain-containing protein n=1 Tax=Salinactinospora qingdaonensis TaxID=702744 RepID=A0ABP7GG05_9ACTN